MPSVLKLTQVLTNFLSSRKIYKRVPAGPIEETPVGRSAEEEKEADFESSSDGSIEKAVPSDGRWVWNLAILFTLPLLSSCTYIITWHVRLGDSACTARMGPWSPLADSVEYEWRRHDSQALPGELYGSVGAETDRAWSQLWNTGLVSFPIDKMNAINKSDHEYFRLPEPRSSSLIMTVERKCMNYTPPPKAILHSE
jgi:hypothetical protein